MCKGVKTGLTIKRGGVENGKEEKEKGFQGGANAKEASNNKHYA